MQNMAAPRWLDSHPGASVLLQLRAYLTEILHTFYPTFDLRGRAGRQSSFPERLGDTGIEHRAER